MLTVYRASAGAGKTHRLTGEYLKLLFSGGAAYRRILAVTFTNKATDEMKGRIIEELYNLASNRPSGYIETLTHEYPQTEVQLRRKAKDTLITILHDYAAFNISTIDRFFQQTMRAFTREIGLQGGYGIEMDQELVLSEAVDNLLAGLEKPESKELLGWLLRFAEEKVENGGEWNLRREIMSLSREIFKESYKVCSDKVNRDIEDKQALEKYKDELYAIIRSTEAKLKALGEKGMSVLRQYALQPSDFKGGNRSALFYLEKFARGEMKEPSATFIGLADSPEACYTKTTPPAMVQIIGCAFSNGLNDCIKTIVAFFNALADYYTAKEIARYYYTLGILNDVALQVAAYRKEKNILLIADTTELLNNIIDGSDTPFIYEKTGTHIDHYMIDEFQDTSDMQWNNFRPLIGESLAHRHNNLIVGDVKQSIYRFRNSNWKLLDEQVQKDFLAEQVREETLMENWRSFRQVVTFNNALFTAAPDLLQTMYNEALRASSLTEEEQQAFQSGILSAYAGSRQLIPPAFQDKEGHVAVEFLPVDEERDWKEEALQRLPSVLERLQDNGYPLKETAILVRTNQDGAFIANALLAYGEEHPQSSYRYDIISDDALYVGSSAAVRFIVALLRHLKNPGDSTNRQMALLAYAALRGRFAGTGQAFPPDVEAALRTLSHHALYEMTEGVFRLFDDHIPDNEQVFVQAFFDMVLEFSQKGNPDPGRFLKWWDETGSRKTIATPDGQDAIRILTIHKSKGLGFKAVILPFCDWEIDHKPVKPVILWCSPGKEPFDRLHLVPVRYGQVLAKTIFAKDYFKERLHACIDNLNTLYVAFTRAKEELIVFAPRPKKVNEKTGKTERINSSADLLWAGIETSFPFDVRTGHFEMGTSRPSPAKQEERAAEEIPMGRIFSISPDERLQLRLHGKGFFFDDARRKHGALMHEILSGIRTRKDIPASVEAFRRDGIISREEAEGMIPRIEELLAHPGVASWYDGSAQVLNEVEILFGKGLTRRPDRVMIYGGRVVVVDYKFGERQTPQHRSQVANYLKLIRQMGYPHVEGFLWYVSLNRIEPVAEG
ncbi:MAG: UvrD-helicase domain-containing protein [Tannerellaceae bacterium]|jgi:ATP-dependent exoDNAse (exonuclease V) beta subunit/CRISPR/Cas system-associated exonuclease Cas4 (RecB family)|nr:UvrD-helicase domain-containing protein [Tannerellaceae bacterium]